MNFFYPYFIYVLLTHLTQEWTILERSKLYNKIMRRTRQGKGIGKACKNRPPFALMVVAK